MELKQPKEAFTFIEKHHNEALLQENSSVLKWMGISGNESFQGMLSGMLTILIIIIGVGAVSLIYNAFSISLRERTTQFGLLSSIGATKKAVEKIHVAGSDCGKCDWNSIGKFSPESAASE